MVKIWIRKFCGTSLPVIVNTKAVEVVNGLGVVGQQPVIEPGESFTYTSGCPLISSIGKMEGYYLFLNLADNSTFKVQIPAFELIPNFALN